MASVLFLNMEGAFPNMVTSRLLLNLHNWRIPETYVAYFKNLLTSHRTKLKFND